jgi:hypothetical protein
LREKGFTLAHVSEVSVYACLALLFLGMVKQSITVERHGGTKLLTLWKPGSREEKQEWDKAKIYPSKSCPHPQ